MNSLIKSRSQSLHRQQNKVYDYQTYMIYGIGIDIVRIQRIKDVVEKWGESFLKRVFTENEIRYCYMKKNPYLSLAVRFAAKEALIKAIGSDIPVSFTEIEIINRDKGIPSVEIHGRLGDFLQEKAVKKIHLSLSHEHDYGVACVVLEHY
jgi:holo-[acyl-carrier protein] synthase